jgi:1-deoxy-D-xylulose-5-phosphate synthase
MTEVKTPLILPTIESPMQLHEMSIAELKQLSDEIRDVLCQLMSQRPAHFASNLGVVELCLALHSTFDFRRDRLIWDTGHQIYREVWPVSYDSNAGRVDGISSPR